MYEIAALFAPSNIAQGPRAQADRELYRLHMQQTLQSQPRLSVLEGDVEDLEFENGVVKSVLLKSGEKIATKAAILTTGTFLGGMIHIGDMQYPAGRFGDAAAHALSRTLAREKFALGRLKTGTPPRLDSRTIRYDVLEKQYGDQPPKPFSFMNETVAHAASQVLCHMTHTNQQTHDIIRENLHRSPNFESGDGKGQGPRYCPSLEVKVQRFKERQAHLVWLEPEGLDTPVVYPNGISVSLPIDVQVRMLRTIRGLENVEMMRPGARHTRLHLP